MLKISRKNFILIFCSIVFILVVAYWFLKNNTFERKIGKWIDKNCVNINNPCIVKISDLTDFSWDKMYVFGPGYQEDEIEQVSKIRPVSSSFAKRKIMFVKDNKIVYYEELPFDFESSVKYQVVFDMWWGGNKDFKEYLLESAIFVAERKKDNYGVYYDLKRLK